MSGECKFYLGPQDGRSDEEIVHLLETSNTIAVVGLSQNTEKDSNMVARYLLEKGYDVIPVNPNHSELLGLRAYPSISDLPENVDMAVIFRRPDALVPIVQETISVKIPALWMQLQIVNNEAYDLAEKNGIFTIMNRCIKVEYERLLAKP